MIRPVPSVHVCRVHMLICYVYEYDYQTGEYRGIPALIKLPFSLDTRSYQHQRLKVLPLFIIPSIATCNSILLSFLCHIMLPFNTFL